jgi:hypothetical protein
MAVTLSAIEPLTWSLFHPFNVAPTSTTPFAVSQHFLIPLHSEFVAGE